MSELARTKRRSAIKLVTTPSVLTSLGIEFRKVKGEEFWHANRAILNDLYREFLTEARNRIRELHPDMGGDAEEFDEFIQAVKRSKKSFARHLNIGIGEKPKEESGVIIVPSAAPPRSNGRWEGFAKPHKILQIIRRMQEGTGSDSFLRFKFSIDHDTIRKIKRLIPLGVCKGCPCGQARNHRFYSCSYRSGNDDWQQYRQYRKLYYFKNSEVIKARVRVWITEHPERYLNMHALYRAAHRIILAEKQKVRYHTRYKHDPDFKRKQFDRREKNRGRQRAYSKDRGQKMTDGYIREQLRKSTGRSSVDFSEEEIEAKRSQISIRRRNPNCPHCGTRAAKSGKPKGRQRYICFSGCKRVFFLEP